MKRVKLLTLCRGCDKLTEINLENGKMADHWADEGGRCELSGRTPYLVNSQEYQELDTAIELFVWCERGFLPLSGVELKVNPETAALSFWHTNGDFICAIESIVARRALVNEDRAMLDYFRETIQQMVKRYFEDTQ